MLTIGPQVKVFLAAQPVDMRCPFRQPRLQSFPVSHQADAFS